MHRIDGADIAPHSNGQNKPGFQQGDPLSGREATEVTASFMNSVQEELCNVIESADIALEKNQNNQLQSAIRSLINKALPAWSSIQNKPDSLGGYGIRDAAPIHSPVFQGAPLAVTAEENSNSTQLATTAFVKRAVNHFMPSGAIVMWGGAIANIPSAWFLCDGKNGTPDLRDRFIVGAGGAYGVKDIGGAAVVTLTEGEMPAHIHTAATDSQGHHQHTGNTDMQGAHAHSYRGHVSQTRLLHSAGEGHDYGVPLKAPSNTEAAGQHAHNFTTHAAGEHTHHIDIKAAGGGQAHENRPPYYALCFIMKA